MRLILLFVFAGLSFSAGAQTNAHAGTNPNPDGPVNVSAPALRPAQPTMYQHVPVQNHGQFYIKNDKPVNSAGQETSFSPATSLSKEEWHKQKAASDNAGNSAIPAQTPAPAKLPTPDAAKTATDQGKAKTGASEGEKDQNKRPATPAETR